MTLPTLVFLEIKNHYGQTTSVEVGKIVAIEEDHRSRATCKIFTSDGRQLPAVFHPSELGEASNAREAVLAKIGEAYAKENQTALDALMESMTATMPHEDVDFS